MARTWAGRGVEVVLRHDDHRIEVMSADAAEAVAGGAKARAIAEFGDIFYDFG